MFSYPLVEGRAETALGSPESVAISEKMARQFFGSAAAAIGQTIRYENRKNLTITAVFVDLPNSVSKKFDFLINWPTFLEDNSWAKDWANNGPATYLLLKKGSDQKAVAKEISRFLDNYNKGQTANSWIELDLQPFRDRYLHSNFKNGVVEGGRSQYVKLFSLVAVFILLIACINFMNLTTARSVKRAKEIGIRKVVGALRSSLIGQFLSEAVLVTALSVIAALVLVFLLLPVFNTLTGKQLVFPLANRFFWLTLLGLTLVTGLVAGSYPALLLSSFKPIRVLKGRLEFGNGAGMFRKGLVVFQFVLSIVLIVGTLIISRQVDFIQHINLGYDRGNLLYVPLEGDLLKKYDLFRQQALDIPGVRAVSWISQGPTDIDNSTGSVDWVGKAPNTSPAFTYVYTSYDLVKTMDLKMTAGRDFSKDFLTDSTGYLVNESALRIIGYKDPIGKPLTMWGVKGRILGVLKDFHFASLHDPIKPFIVHFEDPSQSGGTLLVRIRPEKTAGILAGLKNICQGLNPAFPFTYSFSDDEYSKLYKSEQVITRLSYSFAVLAIFISCMGLLGLAMFTAEQRTREMGIRKVLGATAGSLFTLLSREFVLLVLIALAIATPVAWIAMNKWLLQEYAYAAPIEWWIFGLAGLMAVLITLATVSFQATKAALANPIKSLRSE
jgi:putative ABC transport system permease protein